MRNGNYILVIAPDNYPGRKYRGRYIYEHHLVWWQNTGHIKLDNENIHHINGDTHDNRFENLKLMTHAEHGKLHAVCSIPVIITCAYCGNQHKVQPKNYHTKIKQGQIYFFCSRSCAAKKQAQFGGRLPRSSDGSKRSPVKRRVPGSSPGAAAI